MNMESSLMYHITVTEYIHTLYTRNPAKFYSIHKCSSCPQAGNFKKLGMRINFMSDLGRGGRRINDHCWGEGWEGYNMICALQN